MAADFSALDWLAITTFLGCWLIYHFLVESRSIGHKSLNTRMNAYRHGWATQMLRRDNRMVDVQVMAALHQGSAFFASTSLIAVGGTLSLARGGAGDLTAVMASLPFGVSASPAIWEMKIVGLAIIFIYAFFKFAWAYRLFNYAAILLGAMPSASQIDDAADRQARRCAEMTVVAGRHFNRGQRAFFFALAYLGWFLGPVVFIGATIAALIVIARRQFASDALDALLHEEQVTKPRTPATGQG